MLRCQRFEMNTICIISSKTRLWVNFEECMGTVEINQDYRELSFGLFSVYVHQDIIKAKPVHYNHRKGKLIKPLTLLFYINNTKHLIINMQLIYKIFSIILMHCKIYILDYLHRMTLLILADTIVHSNWSKFAT